MSFFSELKRRNVLRVAAAYIVASWLIIQVVETLFPVFGLADGAIRAGNLPLNNSSPSTMILISRGT